MDQQLSPKSLVAIVLCALLAGCSSVTVVGESLELVVDGQPRATIVLAEKPTGSAQLAAYELQYHIKKISGAELPIVREPQAVDGTVVLVGQSNAANRLGYSNDAFEEQEYTIKTFPKALLLMGYDRQDFADVSYEDYNSLYKTVGGPIGTCYAVHSFIEKVLGVRWYYPNEEIGEIIPTTATIALKKLDIRRSPDAPVRPVYPLFANTEKLYFTDWDDRDKFKSSMINARTSLLYWIRHRFWASMLYNSNHSFVDYDVAFAESHPEWFSTKSYEKMQKLDYQSGVQPCLTAPGFFEQVLQIARDYFDGKEAKHWGFVRSAQGNVFSMVPNDNTNMCGCPSCRAQYRSDVGPGGNASHYVWGFVNRLAREIRKTHPDAIISGLAYFNYTTPPKGLVLESNVAATFCKFYNGYWDSKYRDRDHQRIAEYVNENKVRFFTTWEYMVHPWFTEWCFPCLVPHVHDQDVKRLADLGFKGGKTGGLALHASRGKKLGSLAWASPVLDFMNRYWRMKLYDDFDLDIDKALEEYYEKFFGPGATGMRKFYTAMEDRWMDPKLRERSGSGSNARVWWGYLGTREFLDQVAGHIQQARDATAPGTIYRKRVELVDAGIMQHMVKARKRYEESAMSQNVPVATAAVAWRNADTPADTWANDATWADTPSLEIQKTILNKPVPQKTIFRLAYDSKNLYIYAKCLEPKASDIKAATRDDDIGGFSDDSIELFLDPTGTGQTYYQFCINSNGAVYDALETPSAPGATATVTWNSGIKVTGAVGKDNWELRAALPFAGLVKKTPRPGDTWRFNLCRNRRAESTYPVSSFSAWSVTFGTFRNPDRFGIITFSPQP